MHQLNSCSGGCVSRKICGPLIRLRSRRVSQYQTFGFDPDPPFSSPRVFLAIRSMSAIGVVCHWSLARPAATRFPSSINIAVIVLPHRGQFRRGPLMRNTCSKSSSWEWWC
jgi:hypothetical protein